MRVAGKASIAFLLTSAVSSVALAQNPASCAVQARYTILVHGGTAANAADVTQQRLDVIRSVVTDARRELAAGTAALDVVVNVIVKLENSGSMNAGKGSFRNTSGFTETDASLMDGRTGRTGAVAAMQRLMSAG